MGRTSSNRTSSSLLNLALAAFYLNFTVKNADGSQFYQVGPVMPVALPPFDPAPVPWPEALGRYSQAGSQGFQGYGDNYKGTGGYRDGNGYYDDLMSTRNAYDIGKAYGGGQDYSKGAVAGGGYRDLSGRNKGHQAAGFSNSYRKDESGDKSTYYDDGLGHNARINYAAQDARGTSAQNGADAVKDTVEGLLDAFITILSSPALQGKGNITRIEKETNLDPNTTLTQGFLFRSVSFE
uniref:Uncharacterized protein n=1 Tax=Lygus hesperus TaxID=30085 RepID=A0A0A9VUN2_LYGHE